MKEPAAPVLPARLETAVPLEEAVGYAVTKQEPVDGFSFAGGALEGAQLDKLECFGCRFTGCRFTGAFAERLYLRDCVLERCDLSALHALEATLVRCVLRDCKLTGANFSGGVLRDAVLEACRMEGASLAEAHLEDARFEDCALRGAALGGFVPRSRFSFLRCDLREADFSHTSLAGQDLTTCELDGARFAGGELRGARVTPLQACELARLLGVVVV